MPQLFDLFACCPHDSTISHTRWEAPWQASLVSLSLKGADGMAESPSYVLCGGVVVCQPYLLHRRESVQPEIFSGSTMWPDSFEAESVHPPSQHRYIADLMP